MPAFCRRFCCVYLQDISPLLHSSAPPHCTSFRAVQQLHGEGFCLLSPPCAPAAPSSSYLSRLAGPREAITLIFLVPLGRELLLLPEGWFLPALDFSLSLESPGTIKQFFISLVAAAASVCCANIPQCSPAPALASAQPHPAEMESKQKALRAPGAQSSCEPSPWLLSQLCCCWSRAQACQGSGAAWKSLCCAFKRA